MLTNKIFFIKLYSFYNDKETSYFNLYKSRTLARLVARGRRFGGFFVGGNQSTRRKPNVVELVTT